MSTHDQVRATVFRVLDELNEQLPSDQRLNKDDVTPLAGPDGRLDSLGLVNLIALLEEKIEQDFRTPINLIDDGALGDGAVFETVGALVTFVSSVLRERAHV
jgi:acyl carrier protein